MHLDWWTIGLQTINFGILVWLLYRFLYKPVLTMIDARKAEVRRQFDTVRDFEAKANAELAAVEAERAGIAAEREAALKAAAARTGRTRRTGPDGFNAQDARLRARKRAR
jgi:F-type H+-transporting ATPase subunit b